MKMYRLIALLLLITGYVKAQDTLPIYRKLAEIAVIDQKVMIPMRDGVRLATDIYRPKGNGKHPIVLSRTPYNFNSWVDGKITFRSFEEAY
jgi:predicted acyl esterase